MPSWTNTETPSGPSYTTTLNNGALRITQSFSFDASGHQMSFDNTEFVVGPGAIKWSIGAVSLGSGLQPALSLAYNIFMVPDHGSVSLGLFNANITILRNTPQNGMHTYILPLGTERSGGLVVAELQVFDNMIVDGVEREIEQTVNLVNSTGSFNQYRLVINIPVFQRNVSYDPIISLGVVGRPTSSSTASSTTALALTLAVGLPLILLVIIMIAVIAIWWRRTRQRERLQRRIEGSDNEM